MTRSYTIETIGLEKRYGSADAVRGLTMTAFPGQITGFLGRNGAGKSTTIKMLLGMTRPTAGVGYVLGNRIDDPDENCRIRQCVAYVGEDKQTYPYFTVEENIRFIRSFYRDWRPEVESRLLKEYELPVKRKLKTLSKGMRTKLSLLLALSRRPALLILDEPSEGLDPVAIENLLAMLASASADETTVFFSSHQIAEVERIADRVCIIDHGTLVADVTLDDLRSTYRRLTLGFADPPSRSDFQLDGVKRIDIDGRQMSLLVTGNTEAIVSRAGQLGAVSVEVEAVSLREVFLESVKEV